MHISSHSHATNHHSTRTASGAKFFWRGSAALLAILVLAFAAHAQTTRPIKERPRSFLLNDSSQDQVERKSLPALDAQKLNEEDRARDRNTEDPRPHRFAVAANVSYTLTNSGTWQTVSDGRLWRLRIHSPGSKTINLGITRFELTNGAKLWVYNLDHSHVEGPYTSRDRTPRGSLWTPVVRGEEIVVELFVPTGSAQPTMTITRVNRGYRGFEQDTLPGASPSGACQVDVICPEGDPWRNQIRAVGVYTLGGSVACSGTMMNNTTGDRRPFFMSANHCGVNSTTDSSVVMYWNFESPTCGTHGPGSTADNQVGGATFRAGFAPSDVVLFELNTMPNAAFNVFYAGWDATGTAPPGAVAIHHPSGDVKAIALSSTAPQSSQWTGTFPTGGVLDASGNHWRVIWNAGGTEGGSSGACLFRTDTGRCIGQNHGGQWACTTTNPENHYGKFSVSWTGGGTNATRLSNWLDPGGTGVMTLDGDPHITTANGIHYDFQGAGEYVSVRAGAMEIQTRMTPIATTFFPGPDPHDGVASCVSIISAVAMQLGTHRVTYQPNLSGVPDPSGMQLRVDGVLTTVGPGGLNLAGGSRITSTSAPGGLEVHFPNGHVAFITPGYWADQGKWYLNVGIDGGRALNGIDGSGAGTAPLSGIAGSVPNGSWLPRLPDGTSMGSMPVAIQDRYNDLYQRFGGAWRVTDAISLFDYAAGTSTATFTMLGWPLRNGPCVVPNEKPAEPASEAVAERACRQVKDPNARRNCVFDVRVTGHTGFATTYIQSENVLTGSTTSVTPPSVSTSGKWALFLDAGANIPHSPFSSFFNTGPSFNAGLEYMATSNFSVEGIFGYHRFRSDLLGSGTNVFQLSGNAKVYLLPSPNSIRPFINGGAGAYKFDPGSTRLGGNVGAGLLFEVTPNFGVQGSYNFHAVNTPGSSFRFSTVQGGVRFVF